MAEAARALGTRDEAAFDVAIEHFEQSIQLLPDQWNSYLEIGDLHKERGDFARMHESALALHASVEAALDRPDVETALKATGCEVSAAAIYFVPVDGTKELALNWIRRSIELWPTANRHFKEALAWMSQAITNETTTAAAKQGFTAALALDPNHQGARQKLAMFD